MENEEIWKDCKGYEGLYQVSNLGRIWSVKSQRVLKPWFNCKGYLYVSLMTKGGKVKKEAVHRLVALAFLERVEGKTTVDHIDRNPLNNNVCNLRWADYVDQASNQAHYKQKVKCIETGKIFNSVRDAEKYTGNKHITDVCKGKRRFAAGYRWEYVGDIYYAVD